MLQRQPRGRPCQFAHTQSRISGGSSTCARACATACSVAAPRRSGSGNQRDVFASSPSRATRICSHLNTTVGSGTRDAPARRRAADRFSGGAADLESDVSFSGDSDGTIGGVVSPGGVQVAARWAGSGVRRGRLVFTLRGSVQPGVYVLPIRFLHRPLTSVAGRHDGSLERSGVSSADQSKASRDETRRSSVGRPDGSPPETRRAYNIPPAASGRWNRESLVRARPAKGHVVSPVRGEASRRDGQS